MRHRLPSDQQGVWVPVAAVIIVSLIAISTALYILRQVPAMQYREEQQYSRELEEGLVRLQGRLREAGTGEAVTLQPFLAPRPADISVGVRQATLLSVADSPQAAIRVITHNTRLDFEEGMHRSENGLSENIYIVNDPRSLSYGAITLDNHWLGNRFITKTHRAPAFNEMTSSKYQFSMRFVAQADENIVNARVYVYRMALFEGADNWLFWIARDSNGKPGDRVGVEVKENLDEHLGTGTYGQGWVHIRGLGARVYRDNVYHLVVANSGDVYNDPNVYNYIVVSFLQPRNITWVDNGVRNENRAVLFKGISVGGANEQWTEFEYEPIYILDVDRDFNGVVDAYEGNPYHTGFKFYDDKYFYADIGSYGDDQLYFSYMYRDTPYSAGVINSNSWDAPDNCWGENISISSPITLTAIEVPVNRDGNPAYDLNVIIENSTWSENHALKPVDVRPGDTPYWYRVTFDRPSRLTPGNYRLYLRVPGYTKYDYYRVPLDNASGAPVNMSWGGAASQAIFSGDNGISWTRFDNVDMPFRLVLENYRSPGMYTSPVLSGANGRRVKWLNLAWDAEVPAGTSAVVEARVGDMAQPGNPNPLVDNPNFPWSGWRRVENGQDLGAVFGDNQVANCLQYRIRLFTTNPALAPVVRAVYARYYEGGGVTRPALLLKWVQTTEGDFNTWSAHENTQVQGDSVTLSITGTGAGVWTQLTDALKIGDYGLGLAGTGSYIYLASDAGTTQHFWRYDPTTLTWVERATEPQQFKNGTELVWDGSRYFYVFFGGAYGDTGASARHYFYRYDTVGDTWSAALTDTSTVNSDGQGAGDAATWVPGSTIDVPNDNFIYAMVGSKPTDHGYGFGRYSIVNNSWTALSTPTFWDGVDDGASMAWDGGDYLYVFQGERSETAVNNKWAKYNLQTSTWTSLPDLPFTPYGGTGDGGTLRWLGLWGVRPGSFFATSGGTYDETGSRDFWEYDISSGAWTELAKITIGDNTDAGGVTKYNGKRLAYAAGSIYAWQGRESTAAGGGNDFAKYTLGTYAENGYFESASFDAGENVHWRRVEFDIGQPSGTSATVKVRFSDNGTGWSSWYTVTSGQSLGENRSRYAQYRAELSTTENQKTPSFQEFRLYYAFLEAPIRSWTQTDWSGGATGLPPAVVTGEATQYTRAENVNTWASVGDITLIADDNRLWGDNFLVASTSGGDNLNSEVKRLSLRFRARRTENVVAARVYVNGYSQTELAARICRDDSGNPGENLAPENRVLIGNTGWLKIGFSPPARLVGDNVYHIVIRVIATGETRWWVQTDWRGGPKSPVQVGTWPDTYDNFYENENVDWSQPGKIRCENVLGAGAATTIKSTSFEDPEPDPLWGYTKTGAPDDATDLWGRIENGSKGSSATYAFVSRTGLYLFGIQDISTNKPSSVTFDNVDVSANDNVWVHVWVRTTGIDFEGDENYTGYVSVDGGAWVQFFNLAGTALNLSTYTKYSYNVGDTASSVALQIRFNEGTGTGGNDEEYMLDDVSVTGSGIATTYKNGWFTSSIYDATDNQANWNYVDWAETKPANTNIVVKVRFDNSPSGILTKAWTTVANGQALNETTRYAQYRAELTTTDTSVTPELENVRLRYTLPVTTASGTWRQTNWRQGPGVVTWSSARENAFDASDNIDWENSGTPAGDELRLRVAVAGAVENDNVGAEPTTLIDGKSQIGSLQSGTSLENTKVQDGVYENILEQNLATPTTTRENQENTTVVTGDNINSPSYLNADDGQYYKVNSAPSVVVWRYENSDDESTTTSTSFIDKVTLGPFTPISSDNYLIIASAFVTNSGTYMTDVQLVDGAGTVYGGENFQPRDANGVNMYYAFTTHEVLSLTGGASYTFKIQYKTSDAAGTAKIKNARILARKITTFYENTSEDLSETTSTSYVDKLSLTLPSTATAGDYLVIGTAEFTGSSTSYSTYVRLLDDTGATTVAEGLREPTVATTHFYTFAAITRKTLSSFPHTFKIQYYTESGATAYIKRARLTAVKIDDLGADNQFGEVVAATSTTATTYQDKVTLTFTPSAAGDYIVAASAMVKSTTVSAGDELYARLYWVTAAADLGEKVYLPKDGTDYVTFFTMTKVSLDTSSQTFKIQFKCGTGGPTVYIREARIFAVRLPATTYSLNFESTSAPISIPAGSTVTSIRASLNFTSENAATYHLEIYDWTDGSWDHDNSLAHSGVNTVENNLTITVTDTKYLSSDNRVRVRVWTAYETSAHQFWGDRLLFEVDSAPAPEYGLRWEHRITGVATGFDNYYVRIRGYTSGDSENVLVYIWENVAGTWQWSFIDNLTTTEKTITKTIAGADITKYLVGDNLSVKYESADNTDDTQTTIHIDLCNVEEVIPTTYRSRGWLRSSAYDSEDNTTSWGKIEFDNSTPAGTALAVDVQVDNDNVNWPSPWTTYDNGATVGRVGRYCRYRVRENASPDSRETPRFYEVRISWSKAGVAASWASIRVSGPLENKVPYDQSLDENQNVLYSADGTSWQVRNTQPIYVLDLDNNADNSADVYRGNPYAVAGYWNIYSDNYRGEVFTIAGDVSGGDKIARGILVYVMRFGAPSDRLYYELWDVSGGSQLENGVFAENTQVPTSWTWVRKDFSSSHVLLEGRTYRFYLKSPGANSSNYYRWMAPHTELTGTWYRSSTYDGTNSTACRSTNAGVTWLTDDNNRDVIFRFIVENRFRENGYLESLVFDAGENVRWKRVSWQAVTPAGTTVGVKVRSGSNTNPYGGTGWSDWVQATNGGEPGVPNSRYLQYLVKENTTDRSSTSTFHSITFDYQAVGAAVKPPAESTLQTWIQTTRSDFLTGRSGANIDIVSPGDVVIKAASYWGDEFYGTSSFSPKSKLDNDKKVFSIRFTAAENARVYRVRLLTQAVDNGRVVRPGDSMGVADDDNWWRVRICGDSNGYPGAVLPDMFGGLAENYGKPDKTWSWEWFMPYPRLEVRFQLPQLVKDNVYHIVVDARPNMPSYVGQDNYITIVATKPRHPDNMWINYRSNPKRGVLFIDNRYGENSRWEVSWDPTSIVYNREPVYVLDLDTNADNKADNYDGNPYYKGTQSLYGHNYHGQRVVMKKDYGWFPGDNLKVGAIEFVAQAEGKPREVYVRLGTLVDAVLVGPLDVPSEMNFAWVRATLPMSYTLWQGEIYDICLLSPGSDGSNHLDVQTMKTSWAYQDTYCSVTYGAKESPYIYSEDAKTWSTKAYRDIPFRFVVGYRGADNFVSRVFDAGQVVDWQHVEWEATRPPGTSIKVWLSVGSSPNSLVEYGPFSNGESLAGLPNSRYLQYVAELAPDSTMTKAPALHEMRIAYRSGFGSVKLDTRSRYYPRQTLVCEGEAVIVAQNDRSVMSSPPTNMIVVENIPGSENLKVEVNLTLITNTSGRTLVAGTGAGGVGLFMRKPRVYTVRPDNAPNRSSVELIVQTDYPMAWREYLEQASQEINSRNNANSSVSADLDEGWVKLTIDGKGPSGEKDIFYYEAVKELDVVAG